MTTQRTKDDKWDRQIAADAKAGKLDALWAKERETKAVPLGRFLAGNRAAAKGADNRKPVTMRLPEITRAKLRAYATPERSQADIVVAAVATWEP